MAADKQMEIVWKNVRPFGGPAVDLGLWDGRIAALAPDLVVPTDAEVFDGQGMLLLPATVESHAHLDKTLWGQAWWPNAVGDQLTDRITAERRFRAGDAHNDFHGHDARVPSLALAQAFLASGTTRIRSHVDIDTEIGLRNLDALLRTRAAMAGLQDIQLVAFPQSGLLGRPGTYELLDQALAQGADIVGALDPCAIDGDPVGSLDQTFALAQRHNAPIDIHLHEPGDMGAFSLGLLLDRVQAHGLAGRVVVSHGFCLGDLAPTAAGALLERMARLGVALVTSAPPSRAVPPLLACRAAGVRVAGGNDGIRDTWTPYGRPDMLERAMFIGLRYNLRRDTDIALAFDCVAGEGAAVCGFAGHGLAVGDRADLLLVQAATVAEAVCLRPAQRTVLARGRLVAREGVLLPQALAVL